MTTENKPVKGNAGGPIGVVAYRWRKYMGPSFQPDGHVWDYACHISTGPQDTQEELYAGAYVKGLQDEIATLKAAQKNLLSPELLEVGRLAIEDALIEFRDSRISALGRANGLVVREMDGSPSSIIRFGPEDGLMIGLEAMFNHIPAEVAE